MSGRRPERVVIINDRSAEVGGASNLSRLLRSILADEGIPVTFFAGDAGGKAEDAVNLGGVPLVEQGKFSALTSGLYNRRAHAALCELVERSDTPSTIYHVHGWSKILSPSIFQALDGVRERVVLHAHDYFLACPNGGFINYPAGKVCGLTPMSTRCLATQCDKRGYQQKLWRTARHALRQYFFDIRNTPAHIVLLHERMRPYFERAGVAGECMVTIRNPVAPFLDKPDRPWASQDFFFIGRLEAEKGFEEAAKAARKAGVKLNMIGDGVGRTLIERDYPEVALHGWKAKSEIGALVRRARAVVISSRVPEPFGLAALEAAASGIPVIMPDAALLSREIVEAGCGLAYVAGSVPALSECMRRLAADDATVRRMAGNCLRLAPLMANTQASWGAEIVSFYGRVLDQARNEVARPRTVPADMEASLEVRAH